MSEAKLSFKQSNGALFPVWERHTLGELGTFMKGAPLSKADISDEGTPFLLYGELYTTYHEITDSILRKTSAIVDEKYYSRVGDVVIPTSGETPEEISTATCVMVDGCILAGDLLIYRTDDRVDGRIMSYVINHQANKKIARIAQGKSVVHIQAKELAKIEVYIPTMEEQKRIIPLLTAVDARISEQEALIEDLEERKKGLMQKIFSRVLRFKADDGSEFPEWEPMPLSDIFETRNGYTPSKDNDSFWENGTLPWFRMEDIRENGGILSDAIQHITPQAVKKGGLFPANTVIFATSATIGEHALLTVPSLSNQRFTAIIPKDEYRERLLPRFIYYIGFDIDKYGVKHHAISTMPSVNMDDFKAYPFPMVDIQEQKKIVDLFSLIDDHLANERTILKSWQALKTGLLQQMLCK